MTKDELAYFEDVAGRYAGGQYPLHFDFEGATPAGCHQNAELFTERFPDHEIVCGWLVTGIAGAEGFYRIVAHSLNRRPDGSLVDVTPLSSADRETYRFVQHVGDEAQFAMLRTKFPELYFPPLDPLAMSGAFPPDAPF